MEKNNTKKYKQLGMPYGTACGRLRKIVMFKLLQKLGEDICFRCGNKIKDVKNLSIEHKVPWLDSPDPCKLFWDIDNVSFSHLKCNIVVARRSLKKYWTPQERLDADRRINRECQKRRYDRKKRREKYMEKGY